MTETENAKENTGIISAAFDEKRAGAMMNVLKASLWGSDFAPENPDSVIPAEIFEDMKHHAVAGLPKKLIHEVCSCRKSEGTACGTSTGKTLAGGTSACGTSIGKTLVDGTSACGTSTGKTCADIFENSDALEKTWYACSMQTAMVSLVNLEEIRNLTEILGKYGIKPVILKGMAAAIYYPVPELRAPGDIDFTVPADDFDRAEKILEENGYTVEISKTYSRHDHLYKNDVSFEFHRYFTYNKTDIEKRLDARLAEGIANPVCAEINGTKFYMLPPLENGLCLLEHLRHHLFSGLGLRQISDWLLYVNCVLDDRFWKESFKAELEKTELYTLALTFTQMGLEFMGLPKEGHAWAHDDACNPADPELIRDAFRLIWTNGNFGRKFNTDGKNYSGVLNKFKEHPFNYIKQAAVCHMPAANEHPGLLPAAVIKLPFHYARELLRRGGGTKLIRRDLQLSKEQTLILTRLGIYGNPGADQDD